MKARLAVVLVVLAVAMASLSTMVARANHQNVNDGNDVMGMLDIRQVQTFGRNKTPGWEIITSARMTAKQMRNTGFFIVYLDTFGDGRSDYYALVQSTGSKMEGSLLRDPANKRDRRVSKLTVWRPNKRSVTVRVPLNKMNTGGPGRVFYRWFVKTLFTGDNCRRVCIDRAPNRDALMESNGKPSPSPSPTNTEDPGTTEDPGFTESPEEAPTPDATPELSPSPSPPP